MSKVTQFISRNDRERERLIREARAIYESIFPSEASGQTGPVDEIDVSAAFQRPSPRGKLASKRHVLMLEVVKSTRLGPIASPTQEPSGNSLRPLREVT